MLKVLAIHQISLLEQLKFLWNQPTIELRHCDPSRTLIRPCAGFQKFSLLLLCFRRRRTFLSPSLCRHRGRTILSSLTGVSSYINNLLILYFIESITNGSTNLTNFLASLVPILSLYESPSLLSPHFNPHVSKK